MSKKTFFQGASIFSSTKLQNNFPFFTILSAVHDPKMHCIAYGLKCHSYLLVFEEAFSMHDKVNFLAWYESCTLDWTRMTWAAIRKENYHLEFSHFLGNFETCRKLSPRIFSAPKLENETVPLIGNIWTSSEELFETYLCSRAESIIEGKSGHPCRARNIYFCWVWIMQLAAKDFDFEESEEKYFSGSHPSRK